MLSSDDPTFVIAGAMYWSVIEINVGILAASIPSFKALAKRYAPRLLGSNYMYNADPSGKASGGEFQMKPWKGRQNISGASKQEGDLEYVSEQRITGGCTSRRGVNWGETTVQKGLADNDSEEILVGQEGRIEVKTEISQYEEARR